MLIASFKLRLPALALAIGALSACGGEPSDPTPAETPETAQTLPAAEPAPAATTEAPIDLANADAAAGKAMFESKCLVCHSVVAGTGSAIGPHLDGVVGRKIASVADFAYSPALSAHQGDWEPQTLSSFLSAPQKFAPGTMMAFAGLRDTSERANLIAYLASTK